MSIPKYGEIQAEALKILKQNGVLKLKDFEEPLAKVFKLSKDEIEEKYSSGKTDLKIFYGRIGWALSYLSMTHLVEKPKRGEFKISDLGLSLLKTPEKIEDYVASKMKARNSSTIKEIKDSSHVDKYELTPSETIFNAFDEIKKNIYSEILDTIINKTPREFEKLVVELLQKMGYGGEIKNAGEVTQYSNDNGIDGIIKEDVLGFGKIYIQAKRYQKENKIGIEDLNKFVGALAVAQSSKGVFITTSSFTKNAIDYVNKLNNSTTLVLIDGEKLAEYIYDYALGMQTVQTIEIKKMDSDYWDTMEDEKR